MTMMMTLFVSTKPAFAGFVDVDLGTFTVSPGQTQTVVATPDFGVIGGHPTHVEFFLTLVLAGWGAQTEDLGILLENPNGVTHQVNSGNIVFNADISWGVWGFNSPPGETGVEYSDQFRIGEYPFKLGPWTWTMVHSNGIVPFESSTWEVWCRFSVQPVPAPGALALFGLVGLVGRRRRR